MIDIKKEMTIKVDHPVPYLVDLVGKLVKERDKAVALCVGLRADLNSEYGRSGNCSEAWEWVVEQIDKGEK